MHDLIMSVALELFILSDIETLPAEKVAIAASRFAAGSLKL